MSECTQQLKSQCEMNLRMNLKLGKNVRIAAAEKADFGKLQGASHYRVL